MKHEKRLNLNGVYILFDKLEINMNHVKIMKNGDMVGHFKANEHLVKHYMTSKAAGIVYFKLVEVANETIS